MATDWSIGMIDMPQPGHFHVHICGEGREHPHLVVTVNTDDDPVLAEAYEAFRDAMGMHVNRLLYDLASPTIPDTPDAIMRRCRICDAPATHTIGPSPYCDVHPTAGT